MEADTHEDAFRSVITARTGTPAKLDREMGEDWGGPLGVVVTEGSIGYTNTSVTSIVHITSTSRPVEKETGAVASEEAPTSGTFVCITTTVV